MAIPSPFMALLLFFLGMTGCKSYSQLHDLSSGFPLDYHYFAGNLINQSYALADNLIKNMEEVALTTTSMPIGKDGPILSTTFVDVTTLEPESTFGRIMADQVAARFVQKGYHLIETKIRKDGLLVHNRMGEVLLSRRIQEAPVEPAFSPVRVSP